MLMITLSAEEKRAMCSKLAAELPKIRALLGATQEGFGELCGLSRITISRIENGQRAVTDIEIDAISRVLHVSLDTLFGRGDQAVMK